MKAIVIDTAGGRPELRELGDDELMPGDVTIRVSHSTLNYKDGMALVSGAPVIRRYPMIPGIDLAGVVENSADARFAPGDRVLLDGWGIGEAHFGGYAERARVSGDWLVPLPASLTPERAMAIGTAGYTAMLALIALERYGLAPRDGAVLVTGAAGGLGSIAITLLAAGGWQVVASTGRLSESAYLRDLGATTVIARDELSRASAPVVSARWIAGIDSVGSTTLASALAATAYGGAIAACGVAGGIDLPGTVIPFVLRGVALLGIDSVRAPSERRVEAWERLSRELDVAKLDAMSRTVGLADVIALAPEILAGRIRGRIVVAM